MFGKGIYFADVVSKAAMSCFTPRVDKQCLLLLCDVAVGNQTKLLKPKVLNKAPKFTHSVVGLGKFGPGNFEMLDGSRIGYGEPIENAVIENSHQCSESSFMYNEHVVYDTAQVRMAYLVLCDVEYNQN
jgi:poly [ADP-ribose] polymerase